MSLRGTVVPVIDLRVRLGIEPTLTYDTAVIICEMRSSVVGIVVDQIHTVIAPESSEILKAPQISDEYDTDYVKHVIRRTGHLLLILSISQILKSVESVVLKLAEKQDTETLAA